jgi:hypothetical protein
MIKNNIIGKKILKIIFWLKLLKLEKKNSFLNFQLEYS